MQKVTSVLLIVAVVVFFYPTKTVYAAALLNKSDTLSSQKISTLSNHTIVFRTPTGAAESGDTITITFPAGFGLNNIDFGDVDLAHSAGGQSNCTAPTYTNDETLAASATGSAWGFATSSQVMTLTPPTDGVGAAAIAANACLQIQLGTNATTGGTGDTQITNHGSAASYTISIGGNFGDSGDIVINILNDDQVSVSATVDETLTFTISDNSIGFGTLSASDDFFATGDTNGSATETEAHTLVVGTNAANGYTMTVNGNTLTFGGSTIDAIGSSAASSTPGTEQFGLRMEASGGVGAVSAPYAAPASFAFDTGAFPDEVAAATAPSANTTYSVRYLANIGSNTEAGAYTATLTYVAVANF